ncbi:hypothetical protein [Variovorax gossypii]
MDSLGTTSILIFWFLFAFLALAGVAWFCGLVPQSLFGHRKDRAASERERFEAYWAGRDDIAGKHVAWSAWQARGASSGLLSVAEILASVFGIFGSVLFAIPHIHPTWGFAAFLASNLAAIPFNKRQGNRWILVQQRFFLVSSLVGLWNWWLGPLALG